MELVADVTKCPLCGVPTRIVRRADGSADHYEHLTDDEANSVPNPCPPILQDYLRAKRKGKRTVALVGSAYTSGPWAPFGEDDVEVWCSNEMHGKPWMKEGSTAWFQIHPRESFMQEHRFDHWGWLQQEHPFPIYMQRKFEDIPSSTRFPLREMQEELLGNFIRGEEEVRKLFSSSFSYQTAFAIHQGVYDRIEIYGIELVLEGEYKWQREAMAYWIGQANGRGIDVWIPDVCSLLLQPLYGYEEIRKGNSGAVIWSKEEK